MTPQIGNVAEVVYATGVVEPTYWAKVSALQRKRIVALCHCEGKVVHKGDSVGQLEDAEERAALAEIEARLARLREDRQRLETLLNRNVATRTSYDDKVTQIREYEARVAAQRDRVADLVLKAPMDGIVLRRDGEVGEIAGIGNADVLLWIGQPRPLRIVAEVNEDDIVKIRPGQKVLLRHEGHLAGPLAATVGTITPKGDPLTKTFRVYLDLPDDTPLMIGMSIEANVVVREVLGALLVPAEALAESATVFRVENGRAQPAAVDVGIRGTRMVEVRGGITGATKIVSPVRKDLTGGVRVRPRQIGAP